MRLLRYEFAERGGVRDFGLFLFVFGGNLLDHFARHDRDGSGFRSWCGFGDLHRRLREKCIIILGERAGTIGAEQERNRRNGGREGRGPLELVGHPVKTRSGGHPVQVGKQAARGSAITCLDAADLSGGPRLRACPPDRIAMRCRPRVLGERPIYAAIGEVKLQPPIRRRTVFHLRYPTPRSRDQGPADGAAVGSFRYLLVLPRFLPTAWFHPFAACAHGDR